MIRASFKAAEAKKCASRHGSTLAQAAAEDAGASCDGLARAGGLINSRVSSPLIAPSAGFTESEQPKGWGVSSRSRRIAAARMRLARFSAPWYLTRMSLLRLEIFGSVVGRRWVKFATALSTVILLQFAPTQAHAQSDESAFTYGFRGLGIGVPIGLSAGYLLTRDSSWGTEDWQDLGLGVAIGAISGAAGGLAVGLADLSDGHSGMGAIVLRDTWYGTLLGVTVGAIVGAVRLMDSGRGQDILVSMAWGAVIGAPVGVGVGFAEAAMRGEMSQSNAPPSAGASLHAIPEGSLQFTVAPVVINPAERRFSWMPMLSGTF